MEKEKDNFFRFICLMTEVAPEVLRCRLKQSYRNSNVQTLTSFLNDTDVLHTVFHLFYPKHLCCWNICRGQPVKGFSIEQWKILYDADPTKCCKQNQKDINKICVCCVFPKHVVESDLDLSLLSLILNNCCNLMPHEKEAVQQFREMKNEYISHNPKCSLSLSDFESLWYRAEYNIKHLDSTHKYLNKQQNLLHRPMDESLMQKYFVCSLESAKMDHLESEIKVVHGIINKGNENVIEAIRDSFKRGSEHMIEALQEIKSSFKNHRHARDDEEADDVVHCIATKRKREESMNLFDVSYEQEHEDANDFISPKRKTKWYNDSFKVDTDDWTYKPADSKVHDMYKEYISSNQLGSDISTSVSLETDYTILTMKGLTKQPGYKDADKFICGKCCQLFVSLDQFMKHKGECALRQKENELVKNEYRKYVVARITVPTKDQDLSAEVVKDWKEDKLNPKHNSIEVNYITKGSVVIWAKVDIIVFLNIKQFYSAIDDLVNSIFKNYPVNVPLHRVQVYDIATGYVDHIMDEFYCGDCMLNCNTLDDFISHKKTRCFQSPSSTPCIQAQSQTDWTTCYSIGNTVCSRFNIIDTPGFGDTRSLVEHYKRIVSQIGELFTANGERGIDVLDAFCFLVKAPDSRLIVTQTYILESILSMFGNYLKENICTLETIADGQKPPILIGIEAILDVPLPYEKYLTFNNSALYAHNTENPHGNFSSFFWNMGIESCDRFFEHVRTLSSKSLKLTAEVLLNGEKLENTVTNLQKEIDNGMSKIITLESETRIFTENKEAIEANKNFTYEVDEIRQKETSIEEKGQYTTTCLVCNYTCHEICKIPKDENKAGCIAMKNGIYTQCPGACHWQEHWNTGYKIKVKKTYADMEKIYRKANEKKLTLEQVIEKLEKKLKELDDEIQVIREIMNTLDNRIKEILHEHPLSTVQYIDLFIAAEKQELKTGFEFRIRALERYKALVNIYKSVEDFQTRSTSAMSASQVADETLKDDKAIMNSLWTFFKKRNDKH